MLQTGTGFIKVDDTNKAGFELGSESENAHHASCKGNPATNEWTPAPADMVKLKLTLFFFIKINI